MGAPYNEDHQHAHGPIFKKNRTNLDTLAWYIVAPHAATYCR